MATRVNVPYMGLTTEEVTVTQWLKQVGETVGKDDPIVEVLTDKVNTVIEAPAAGVLLKILTPIDTVVPVTEGLCWIGQPGEELVEEETPPVAAGTEEAAPVPKAQQPVLVVEPAKAEATKASPVAKRLARELGIDLAEVSGTGPGGRITEKDVAGFVERRSEVRATPLARKVADEAGTDLSEVVGTGIGGRVKADDVTKAARRPVPAGEAAAPAATRSSGPLAPAAVEDVVPMSGLRRIVAQRMFQSAHSVARVTHTTEVDVTETVRMREGIAALAEKRGAIRPSYTDIIVKIAAIALRQHPRMNARLADEEVELLGSINVGIAVAVPNGLTVPVIHDADCKDLSTIVEEARRKIEAARSGTLATEDVNGGTFTVTTLGTYEIDAFTPIINLPEAGILGVGRIIKKPAVVDDQIMIRHMMYLSLSFDHRIIDGAPAAEFLRTIKQYLEQPYALLLARSGGIH